MDDSRNDYHQLGSQLGQPQVPHCRLDADLLSYQKTVSTGHVAEEAGQMLIVLRQMVCFSCGVSGNEAKGLEQ